MLLTWLCHALLLIFVPAKVSKRHVKGRSKACHGKLQAKVSNKHVKGISKLCVYTHVHTLHIGRACLDMPVAHFCWHLVLACLGPHPHQSCTKTQHNHDNNNDIKRTNGRNTCISYICTHLQERTAAVSQTLAVEVCVVGEEEGALL